MKRMIIIFLSLLSFSLGTAFGAPGKGSAKGPKPFESFDKDGNHKLTKEEVATAPRMSEDFDRIDTDKDGTISEEELTAYRAANKGQRMNR